jgi:hypothetical protein
MVLESTRPIIGLESYKLDPYNPFCVTGLSYLQGRVELLIGLAVLYFPIFNLRPTQHRNIEGNF